MDLFLYLLFSCTILCQNQGYLCYCCPITYLWSGIMIPLAHFLLRISLVLRGLLYFHMNFIIFFSSLKNVVGILMELNWYCTIFDNITIFVENVFILKLFKFGNRKHVRRGKKKEKYKVYRQIFTSWTSHILTIH